MEVIVRIVALTSVLRKLSRHQFRNVSGSCFTFQVRMVLHDLIDPKSHFFLEQLNLLMWIGFAIRVDTFYQMFVYPTNCLRVYGRLGCCLPI